MNPAKRISILVFFLGFEADYSGPMSPTSIFTFILFVPPPARKTSRKQMILEDPVNKVREI